jgi:2-keto-3-deoxy-L-rhamnonate aldolase RhmA
MQSALDCGSAGLLIPCVSSPSDALAVAAACRYRRGRRGFSNSPRAASFGAIGMWDHINSSDEATTVIAMIEDVEGLKHVAEIAATAGIDGLFIGRADLALSLNASGPDADEVADAVKLICEVAQRARKPVMAMITRTAEHEALSAAGVSAFIVSSDQGLLRRAALDAVAEFRATKP